MATLLPRPILPRPPARVVSTIKLKKSYMGFHTPPLGKDLSMEDVTEASVLGFDDRRDAMRMAASLMAHKRASYSWPNRVIDPDRGFWVLGAADACLDIGELRVVDEPFEEFMHHLALNNVSLRTIMRVCDGQRGSLQSVVHKPYVSAADRQKQLDKLLLKQAPEHF